jgi:NarL family two-component system response regulator LiaR
MPESQKIRVIITDDHAVVRNGLKSFLAAYEDFELVGEAKNGEQAVRLCIQSQPDIILMDLVMPGMDGATATRAIREKHPQVRVIALTSFSDQELVQSAIQAGATGYLLKDVSAEELAHAIRQVCAGKPVLAPEATQALIHSALHPEPQPGGDLTGREREVLALMVEGLNNQQIAGRLVISLSTAKAHVSSILSKLGVTSRTEAVSLALKNKLVM